MPFREPCIILASSLKPWRPQATLWNSTPDLAAKSFHKHLHTAAIFPFPLHHLHLAKISLLPSLPPLDVMTKRQRSALHLSTTVIQYAPSVCTEFIFSLWFFKIQPYPTLLPHAVFLVPFCLFWASLVVVVFCLPLYFCFSLCFEGFFSSVYAVLNFLR